MRLPLRAEIIIRAPVPAHNHNGGTLMRYRYLLTLVALTLSAQTPPTTAIRCGRFFDGKNLTLQENVVVLVQGNRIQAVGKQVAVPPGAQVIDLSRATVMPGLIDSHTHMFLNGIR